MVEGSFWGHLERLVSESRIVIDIPRGAENTRFPGGPYPVDYGSLEGTSSMDGDGIDIFVGSDPRRQVDAIVCTVDLVKRDSEIKVLIGCTEEEKQLILRLYESFPPMRGVLIR